MKPAGPAFAPGEKLMQEYKEYWLDGWKNYVNFNGRTRRMAFWSFVLGNLIIAIILGIILGALFSAGSLIASGISGLWSLAQILPGISIGMRRFHDLGKSGWWLLLALIPIIGWIALLYFYVQDSQPGSNAYGPNPKGM